MEKTISDNYISDCFTIDFEHIKEDRSWKTIEGLDQVPGLVKQDRLPEALRILDSHGQALDDFDFIYAWKAFILQKQGEFKQAEGILLDGIKTARAKNLLCDRLGFLYYESRKIEDAVKWWTRSVLVMTRYKASFLWEPFLYLAYTAKGCGCDKEYQVLIDLAAQSHGEIALTQEAEQDLVRLASEIKGTRIPEAIIRLCITLAPPSPDAGSASMPPENSRSTPSMSLEVGNRFLQSQRSYTWIWVVIAALTIAAAVIFFLSVPASREKTGLPDERSLSVPDRDIPENAPARNRFTAPGPDSGKTKVKDIPVPVLEREAAGKKPAVQTAVPKKPRPAKPIPAPAAGEPVGHKVKPPYLKQKTKQPISNLQKKSSREQTSGKVNPSEFRP